MKEGVSVDLHCVINNAKFTRTRLIKTRVYLSYPRKCVCSHKWFRRPGGGDWSASLPFCIQAIT